MIDLSDGLASDMLQICKNSGCGVRLYLERIPIARETHKMAEELHADPVVAALNGGDDNELLFTVPVTQQAKIAGIGGIDIIGHITPASTGTRLVTPDGSELSLTAPGFREQ
jgi:thiamine-phosphate kinase